MFIATLLPTPYFRRLYCTYCTIVSGGVATSITYALIADQRPLVELRCLPRRDPLSRLHHLRPPHQAPHLRRFPMARHKCVESPWLGPSSEGTSHRRNP